MDHPSDALNLGVGHVLFIIHDALADFHQLLFPIPRQRFN